MLDFTLRSSHGGLAWDCQKPKEPFWSPKASVLRFSSVCWQWEGSNNSSPFLLGSYHVEQLAVEEGAGRHVSQDTPMCQRVVLWQAWGDSSDFTDGNEPKSISKTAQLQAAPHLKGPGSCSDTMAAKDRKVMSYHLFQRLEMDHWP